MTAEETRVRATHVYEALVLALAIAAVVWGFVEWTRDLPTFSVLAVVAMAAIPLLARASIPVETSTHAVTIALTPAVLFAGKPDEAAHLFPLWAVLVVVVSLALQARPRRFNPRLGIQVLAGAALVAATRLTDFGPPPYDQVATGLTAYCVTIWLLESARHRLRRGEARHRVWSIPNLVVAIGLLVLMSTGVAVLRLLLQGAGNTSRTSALLLFAALLALVAVLLARVEHNRMTVRALTDAAVAMPWPVETIDERLARTSRAGVRAWRVDFDGAPGGDGAMSVPLQDRRHLVLRRGPGELAFTRADHKLVQALVAMADTSWAQAAHERRLVTAATTDDLTGLWTFGFFRDTLMTAFHERNPGERIAVYFIDLDRFKEVNETVGHLVADHVVRELGNRLLTQLPVDAFPARFGGDEFLLMLRNVHGPEHCESVRHQIADIVAEPMTVDEAVIKLGCTIGLALSDEVNDDRDRVIAEAEQDMRGRKHLGRSERSPRWVGELNLVRELVDSGGIDVAFQPIVDLRDDSLLGYEALVRATHPAIGRLSPVQTISSAIRLGILDEVTEMIAEQAIDTVSRVAASLGRRLTLSINIEYQQLRDGSALLDWLCQRVEGTGLDVILELSERKIGMWHAVHLRVAQQLRDCGIGLALDDFGAGQATFSVVSEWEWDWVKIDRAFLGAMGERGRTMLPHVIRMLDELGTTIVQEGIETREHLALVRALDVPLGQGIRLGAPQPGDEILARPVVPGLIRP